MIITLIIHATNFLFSDWPKGYSDFSKLAPRTSTSNRLYNNHVTDPPRSRVIVSGTTAVHDF